MGKHPRGSLASFSLDEDHNSLKDYLSSSQSNAKKNKGRQEIPQSILFEIGQKLSIQYQSNYSQGILGKSSSSNHLHLRRSYLNGLFHLLLMSSQPLDKSLCSTIDTAVFQCSPLFQTERFPTFHFNS